MNIIRIQVYGRTRNVRSRTRSIGFEADIESGESIEVATMILQDRVDRALAEWTRALEATDAEEAAEQQAKFEAGGPL